MSDIEKYPDKPWSWYYLSCNEFSYKGNLNSPYIKKIHDAILNSTDLPEELCRIIAEYTV
jgi:hypothetical protein